MSPIPVSASLALVLISSVAFAAGAQQSESTPQRTEQEIKFTIETPAVASAQCEATTTASFDQRNTIARVQGTIKVTGCDAAGGRFTVTVRTRDESGEVKLVELMETWQRADDKDVSFSKDYPIGENVELVSARVRGMTCTCADPSGEN